MTIDVDDHVAALLAACEKGVAGGSYNIGGHNEISNVDLATEICAILDGCRLGSDGQRHKRELGWQQQASLESGLSKAIEWYLDRGNWKMDVLSSEGRSVHRLNLLRENR